MDHWRSLLVPVVHRDAYTIAYEYTSGGLFGHVEMRKWNHKIARRARQDIDTAASLVEMPLYALENPDDPRQPKFLKFCGFRPAGTAQASDGRTVTLYERSTNG